MTNQFEWVLSFAGYGDRESNSSGHDFSRAGTSRENDSFLTAVGPAFSLGEVSLTVGTPTTPEIMWKAHSRIATNSM
jgi:hypothetical protein